MKYLRTVPCSIATLQTVHLFCSLQCLQPPLWVTKCSAKRVPSFNILLCGVISECVPDVSEQTSNSTSFQVSRAQEVQAAKTPPL